MTLEELLRAFQSHAPHVTTLKGALRRMRADILDRDARQQLDALKKSNEAIRRLPHQEHKRILAEIRAETETARRLAAGVALYKANPIPAFAQQTRDFVAAARRNTEFNFPNALDGVTADGTIALALLRMHMATRLESASAAQLFETYSAAVMRQDPASLVEAQICEHIVMTKGARLATSEADRPFAQQLRDYMAKVMDIRVPPEVPAFDELEQEIGQLAERADVVKVRPIDPTTTPAAESAFEQEKQAMTEAGEQSHADYVREAQKGTTS